jgi:proton glutamate symport protein
MRSLPLHWKILIGLALGVLAGLILNQYGPALWKAANVPDPAVFLSPDAATDPDPNADANPLAYVLRFAVKLNATVGALFMNALKFIAVPIVLFSLIVGVSGLNDLKKLSRIGTKTVAIYLCTTALAITIGLVLANIFKPGKALSAESRANFEAQMLAAGERDIVTPPSLWSFITDLIPTNPFASLAAGNMLQVVILGLAVGVALTLIPKDKSAPVTAFFDGMTEVIIKLVTLLMLTAPIAVFALITPQIAGMGLDIVAALAVYCLVVVGGLLIMMFGIYPAVLRLFTSVRFIRFYRAISPAQLFAFSSSSSVATLPISMASVEKRLGVSEEVTSFVLPVGATVNMDGTALYQGVAAVFIAQLFNMDLSISQQLTIVLTATLASIGTAGVPSAGIVMLVVVLQSVGVPTAGIAVILGVDRLLDMCRTTCNVTGDCMVAAVIATTENEILSEEEAQRQFAQATRDENPLGASSSSSKTPAPGTPIPPAPPAIAANGDPKSTTPRP